MKNNQLELTVIREQAHRIGELMSEKIELEIRLMQALQTAEALAKEMEAMQNVNTEFDSEPSEGQHGEKSYNPDSE